MKQNDLKQNKKLPAAPNDQALYDPDLPNANAVLASLCCVAAQYASKPSLELAELAADLAHTLTAPEYAESRLVSEVAQRLFKQWNAILREQGGLVASVMPSNMSTH